MWYFFDDLVDDWLIYSGNSEDYEEYYVGKDYNSEYDFSDVTKSKTTLQIPIQTATLMTMISTHGTQATPIGILIGNVSVFF